MISGWQVKVTKPGSVSLFYKFKPSDIRKRLVEMRKIDNQSRFSDLKYPIFIDLALKMAQNELDDKSIISIDVFNIGERSD